MVHKKPFILIFSLVALFLSGCNKKTTINVFVFYKVSDSCEKMGSIKGTRRQTPYFGDYTTEVTAVANAGYRFVTWNDGNTNATRKDKATDQAMTIYCATFAAI